MFKGYGAMFSFSDTIRYNDQPVFFNGAERCILARVAKLTEGHCVISIPNRNIIIPLALSIFHADYDNYYKNRSDFGRRASILVVTKNMELFRRIFESLAVKTDYLFKTSIDKQRFFSGKRENLINDPYNAQSYWKDHVYKRYKGKIPEYMPYRAVFPVASWHEKLSVLSRDNLGRRDTQRPCFYITSSIKIVAKDDLPKFDGIIVDYSRVKSYVKATYSGAPIIYFFNTLLDDRMLYLKRDAAFFGFDADLISRFKEREIEQGERCDLSVPLETMYNSTELSGIRLEHVPADFDEKLQTCFDNWQTGKRVSGYNPEKKLITSLIKNVLSLPVTAVEYDTVAVEDYFLESNLDMLQELKRSESLYNNEELARCTELLEDVLNALDQSCPKQEYLLRHVEKTVEKRKNMCVITANRVANIALKKVLATFFAVDISELEDMGISVITYGKLDNFLEADYDLVILTACDSLKRIGALQKVIFKRAILLLYTTEVIDLKRRLHSLNEGIFSITAEKSGADEAFQSEVNIYEYLLNRLRSVRVATDRLEVINFDGILEWAQKPGAFKSVIKPGESSIEAKRVFFKDGSYCYVGTHKQLRVLSPSKKIILEVDVDDLEPGDKCVFVDGETHHDMYMHILRKLENNSKYVTYMFLIEKWQETFQDQAIGKEMGHKEIFEELKKRGWKKKRTETVKGWLNGTVLGPDDMEDIRLLGEILNVRFLRENYRQIFGVLEKIRILRRSVAKMLNRMIFEAQKRGGTADEKVLELYGIDKAELMDAIQVKTVRYVEEMNYYIKTHENGKVYDVEGGRMDGS